MENTIEKVNSRNGNVKIVRVMKNLGEINHRITERHDDIRDTIVNRIRKLINTAIQ